MSITSALSNAFTGLSAASRTAEVISNNVANSMTEGYSRKTVDLAARSVAGNGAGVRVAGMQRAADPQATADRRQLDAQAGEAGVLSGARDRLSAIWGTPGTATSLPSRASAMEIALRDLADSPESTSLQSRAVSASRDLTRTVQSISTETARVRVDADASIARQVNIVNSSLREIEQLNREIQVRSASGGDLTSLEDQRQQLIDQVSSLIPIKTYPRGGNQVAVYAKGGGALLDGKAFELGFTPTGVITQDMTIGSGALSGITLNGVDVEIGQGGGLLDGGALTANFEVRDVIAPAEGARIDAYAVDLVTRFQDSAVDTTLAPGDPGLFTIGGLVADPLAPEGAASLLTLNAAVDPAQGGDAWRLRDGMNAATEGAAGNDVILRNFLSALSDPRAPSADAGVGGLYGSSALAAELSSIAASGASQAQAALEARETQLELATTTEMAAMGVDTDQELAHLLLVEQAYAANARVLETVDTLLKRWRFDVMNITGVPDLLSNQRFRTIESSLSRQLEEAGLELTTGKHADVSKAAGGDLRRLYLLEAGMASENAFKDAATRAGARVETALNAVEVIRNSTDGLAIDIIAAVERGDAASAERLADGARNTFGAAVQALNTRYAGRSLFAGAEVNGPALPASEDILTAAFAAMAGAPDAATARTALNDFFLSPTGGYETAMYQGDDAATRMQVDDGIYLALEPNALDEPFRQALYGLALSVAVTENELPATTSERTESLGIAAQSLLDAQPGLLDISADLGGLAEQADTAATEAGNMRVQLELNLSDILSIDPYEAASRLTGIQGALEAALTVQSMTRSLSFVRFIQ
jgi:flagellar hook-associated protein 1 FlgK